MGIKILELTSHYFPNVGGVETHLSDLVKELIQKNNKIFVLTYQPLTTNVKWDMYEKTGNITVLRIPWIANLFYKFVKYPLIEFLYLFPALFLVTPIIILLEAPQVIHAHGLIAGTVAVFWGKIFGKRIVIATHSVYQFPNKGFYRYFVRSVFMKADCIMGLSKKAVKEIISLGITKDKVKKFTYWIDLKKFIRIFNAKKKLGWEFKFIVLFVGRMVVEKGILELIEASRIWNKNINLVIVGAGPLKNKVKNYSSHHQNVTYLDVVTQDELPLYYSGADLLIVPSIHEEGFGRVMLESLACGTPVVASNRGAIPEAITEQVGKLINITPQNIKKVTEYFYFHQSELHQLASNCRKFVERRYSEKNVEAIIKAYRT